MPILYFLAVLSIGYSVADKIRASYGSDVILTADNTIENPLNVEWYFEDENGDQITVIFQAGSSDPTIGTNYTGRVELNYTTAYLKIVDLGCWDEQIYICKVTPRPPQNSQIVGNHTVLLGLPVVEQLNVTVESDGEPSVFMPGDCNSTPRLAINASSDTVEVTITSSVLSAPGVTFTVDGPQVSETCSPAGQCPGEVRCSIEEQYTIDTSDPSDIIVTISYEDVKPWTFCIRPVVLMTTSACECYEECAAYYCIWVPITLAVAIGGGVFGFLAFTGRKPFGKNSNVNNGNGSSGNNETNGNKDANGKNGANGNNDVNGNNGANGTSSANGGNGDKTNLREDSMNFENGAYVA